MSIAAPRRPAYTAERTESGGWRITLPLESVPSANITTREHWRMRMRRVNTLADHAYWISAYYGVARPNKRPPGSKQHITACVFHRARLSLCLYFPRKSRRDPGNYGPGAGAKSLVDALVKSGWLADDDSEHLTSTEPVLLVDRIDPRVVIELEPWDGVRP